jgi:hypothetical protein
VARDGQNGLTSKTRRFFALNTPTKKGLAFTYGYQSKG